MEESLTFKEIIDKTLGLIGEFEKVEKRKWGVEASTIELTKQVGELSKNIMSKEGYYLPARDKDPRYITSKEAIADELSDILFMIIRIAKYYEVDLEKEHLRQINKSLNKLKGK